MATEGVEGCAHANRKLRNIPLEGPFHRKLATGSDIIFPCIFLSGSTKCWFGVYLPPPRGTLTGMFNARVWSLANVTAKASCSRSPCVRVNGMFSALVWSFDFDLRDMSNEV